MKVFLSLYGVEYRAGMMIASVGARRIAETEVFDCGNARALQAAIESFTAPHVGKVDAKLAIYHNGRKFAGFDAIKRVPVELHAIGA